MSYLVGQILLYLLTAAAIGFLLGWFLSRPIPRGSRHTVPPGSSRELAEVRKQRDDLSLQVEDLSGELDELQEKHRAVASELETLRSARAEPQTAATSEPSPELMELLEHLRQRHEELRRQYEEQQRKHDELRSRHDQQRQQYEECIATLENELVEQKSRRSSSPVDSGPGKASGAGEPSKVEPPKSWQGHARADGSATAVEDRVDHAEDLDGEPRLRIEIDAASSPPQGRKPEYPPPIEEVEGIGKTLGSRLRALGLHTTEDLLSKCGTPHGLGAVAASTGMAVSDLRTWTAMADLMRVAGIRRQQSDLLHAIGIGSVQELAAREPRELVARLARVDRERGGTGRTADAESVAKWVETAKSLPRRLDP